MHIFPPIAASYSYPDNRFLAWLYGAGSLMSLMGEYRFTQIGIDALNVWMDRIGDEELTDARRGELQRDHRAMMIDLVGSGDAWKEMNTEWRQTVFWWQTVTPQPA